MDGHNRKLQRAREERREFIEHLPGEVQEILKRLIQEFEKTLKLYRKQEKALEDTDADVTQGAQNLAYLENKGIRLYSEIMNILAPDSKQNTAVPDKGARPGTVSIRPPKPKDRRYTDNSRI
jgi:hypothetical protein